MKNPYTPFIIAALSLCLFFASLDQAIRTSNSPQKVEVGVAWSGLKDNHTVHGFVLPYYAWPLESTDTPGQYIDAEGNQVIFPTDLINWDQPR